MKCDKSNSGHGEVVTFIDLLRSGKFIDIGVEVGGADMEHALVWNEGDDVTDYGYEKYRPLLESECCMRTINGFEFLDIFFEDDYDMAEEFFAAAAGYIADSEHKRIFKEVSE